MNKDELAHHGILGMKWGVRRFQNADGTLTSSGRNRYGVGPENPTGKQTSGSSKGSSKASKPTSVQVRKSVQTRDNEKLSITEDTKSTLAKTLSGISKTIKSEQDKTTNMTVRDSSGNKVGNLQLYKESDDSLNVVWMGVRSKYRGQGYGTTIMKNAIDMAKEKGLKTITLEVPGNSPDARHIYEKLGFKTTAVLSDNDSTWGGLTKMKLELDNELAHHGILGMKWGVRRFQNADGTLTSSGRNRYGVGPENPTGKQTSGSSKGSSKASKPTSVQVRKSVRVAGNLARESSEAAKQLKKVEKSTRPKVDLSKMTDKEMRERINRELIERQYRSVFEGEMNAQLSAGRRFTQNSLNIAESALAATGTALSLTASALTIAMAIKELKK